MQNNTDEQRSLNWFRARLGKWTGSKIGNLFKSGRGKDAMFGEAAKSYIYDVATERTLKMAVVEDDDIFALYIEQVNQSSKATRYGNEQEEYAKSAFTRVTGISIEETGSCQHSQFEHFAASPDGLTDDGGIIEVKCPYNLGIYTKYKSQIKDNETLKQVQPDYFYQMQAEMACTGRNFGYFVSFCPFVEKSLHIVRIERDNDVIAEMYNRITAAEGIVDSIIKAL